MKYSGVLIVFAQLLLATVRAETNLPGGKIIVPLDRTFSAQAIALDKQRIDFDGIFARLCRLAIEELNSNPKLRPADCARSMFGGLWQWSSDTGRPTIQGRADWAQHFIAGGTFEGYFDSGKSAAVKKEQHDSTNPENRFDLDDMAVTMLGSRWMDVATQGSPEEARRWIELWATGEMSISKTLPKLHYGQMPKGVEAPAEMVQKIRADCVAALRLLSP